jgi:hypothetical protein
MEKETLSRELIITRGRFVVGVIEVTEVHGHRYVGRIKFEKKPITVGDVARNNVMPTAEQLRED